MTEQFSDTKQELDLMKEEISSGTGGGSVDNVRIKQLDMQSNQLKDAVIKYSQLFILSLLSTLVLIIGSNNILTLIVFRGEAQKMQSTQQQKNRKCEY